MEGTASIVQGRCLNTTRQKTQSTNQEEYGRNLLKQTQPTNYIHAVDYRKKKRRRRQKQVVGDRKLAGDRQTKHTGGSENKNLESRLSH
jgi:hypothetical protein